MIELGVEIEQYHGAKSEGGANNLYNGLNAADPTNEVNGTANFRTGGGAWTHSSQTTPTPQNGSYFVRANRNTASGNADFEIDLSGLTTGVMTTIQIYTQEIVGSNFQLRMATPAGWQNPKTQNITSGAGWINQVITGIPTSATPRLGFRSTSSGASGDQLGIDNIRVTQ